MLAKLKSGTALLAAISVASLLATSSASAISVEVAKKCDVLTGKAYPLRVPGNPAAGHKNGSAKEIQDYFNKCVANDGNVPDSGQDTTKNPAQPEKRPGRSGARRNQVTESSGTASPRERGAGRSVLNEKPKCPKWLEFGQHPQPPVLSELGQARREIRTRWL